MLMWIPGKFITSRTPASPGLGWGEGFAGTTGLIMRQNKRGEINRRRKRKKGKKTGWLVERYL